ncbi:hypothetical protein B296_00000452 [Ensete ventricosum]|uniref:Uncharacterized protein n=1 Tax=Ensete ventricosum TaxID=4639 RepID=A0A427ANX3_ENSVE|nr:hypothetical protein B296_00000452 [Ensete ventricosum]
MCGLCQHNVRPSPSPIFCSLPWKFTFVHPLLGHTWTKHSSWTVRRLVTHEVPLTSLELVHHCLDPGPISPISTISAMHHLFLTTPMATLWHILQEYSSLRPLAPRLLAYPFHIEEKVLMLHGAEFRSHLGMATNTSASVYKPCMSIESFELAIPLTFVSFAQLFRSLRNTSHFARSHLSPSAPLCLEHRQVWLPTSSYSSN